MLKTSSLPDLYYRAVLKIRHIDQPHLDDGTPGVVVICTDVVS